MKEKKSDDFQEENNRDITTFEIILTVIQELSAFAWLAIKFWCKGIFQKVIKCLRGRKK